MIKAAFKALADLASPEFRGVLWKAIGLTLLLFVGLFATTQAVFWFLTLVPWPWLETLMAVGTGLLLLVAFFFLMSPVTAMFAGIFLDTVAEKVERKHYPTEMPGVAMPALRGALLSLQFGLLVLLLNLLALPFVFTGFGAIVLVTLNAYLLSREYFEMAARRVMPADEAKFFRKENGAAVFVSGFLPALLSLVPILNLTVPLFATSYFVHLFRQVRASSD